MYHIAGFINYWTNGKLKPSHVTALSLAGHITVVIALLYCRPVLAGILLLFFASLDALDGALARIQKNSTLSGMYFDAVADRLKEVMVFSAIAVYINKHVDPTLTWQVVAALGTSLLVSYVKAKAEMAVASTNKKDAQKLNRLFSGGIGSYEYRVIAIILSLIFGGIVFVLPLLIAANSLTIAVRFLVATKVLYQYDVKQKPLKPNVGSKSNSKKPE